MSPDTQVVAPRPLALSVAVGPRVVLAALVFVSAAVRLPLVLQRVTQGYLPDEYLYGQLARSLAEGNGLRVLGVPAGTPALLQPILTAPAWLAGDPEVAFRLTQGINVAAMSLGAVAVYAIARELSLAPWRAVAVAGVALASPDLVYTGYVTADAIAYSLALLAILAAIRTLGHPSPRTQALFLGAAATATLARVQYASLFVAVALATVVVERGRPSAVRRHWPLLTAPVAAGLGIAAFGGLGRYASVTSFGVSTESLRWVPVAMVLLTLATGVVVVPGALAWMGSQLARPTSAARVSLAAITVALVAMLLVASALITTETDSNRFLERYLMLGAPLALIAFCCWADEGRPLWPAALGLAAVLALTVSRMPVSEYVVGQGTADSPLLMAVARLQTALGVGTSSLVVALAATAGAGLAVATALGRLHVRGALLVTALALTLVSVVAHEADNRGSVANARKNLGGTPNWVDRAAGRDDVLLVVSSPGVPSSAMLTSLNNASVSGIALLGSDVRPFDGAAERLSVDRSGLLRLRGGVLRRPLVVGGPSTRVVPANARRLARAGSLTLLEPHGPARLAATLTGLYSDGWLAGGGTLTLYGTGRPGACRRASLHLALPPGSTPVTLTFAGSGVRHVVRVAPGAQRTVEIEGDPAARTVVELTSSPSHWQSEPSIRSVSTRAVLVTSVGPCAPFRA